MKLRISRSQGAIQDDWFVVKPLEGNTEHTLGGVLTHDQAVMSLLSYGRDVYTVDLDQMTVIKEELTP